MRNTRVLTTVTITAETVSTLLIACAIRAAFTRCGSEAPGFNAINSMRNTREWSKQSASLLDCFNAINSMRNTRHQQSSLCRQLYSFNAINSMRNTRCTVCVRQLWHKFQRY